MFDNVIVVTGGRKFSNRGLVFQMMNSAPYKPNLIIDGGALTGVDEWVRQWCVQYQVDHLMIPAKWNKYDRAAGPKRNVVMAEMTKKFGDSGKKIACLSFPGGSGTAHMTKTCLDLGVPTYKWDLVKWYLVTRDEDDGA